MANLLDYITWRGDLSFSNAPLNEIDRLIFCRLSYFPWQGIVKPEFTPPYISLRQALVQIQSRLQQGGVWQLPMKDDEKLLTLLLSCPRFTNLQLCGFSSLSNRQKQEQFAAITIRLPDSLYLSFRGTDGTLIGWKEDFNMSFSDTVPAQTDAVHYTQQAAAAYEGNLRLGGHSKGGNLAVYAAAFCPPETQRRILEVRNMDGPGFSQETIKKEGFQRILNRVETFIPQSSVIGMLLEHDENFTIVRSDAIGLAQHNLYAWLVYRKHFITVGAVTNASRFIDRTLKDWLAAMSPKQREGFIDSVFDILTAGGIENLQDIWQTKNATALLKAVNQLDASGKRDILQAFSLLRASLKKSLPSVLQEIYRT